jgi:hypothetical protein
LIVLPRDVFSPVDFFAFLRLAGILCGEDPFVGMAELGVDSMMAAAGMSDSARFDSDAEWSGGIHVEAIPQFSDAAMSQWARTSVQM